jgi:HSP20 family molecular chaperone IbpA
MSLFQSFVAPTRRSLGSDAAQSDETIRPVYRVTEKDDVFSLTVQLPGVAKDGLEITAEGGELRIVGRRAWKQPEGWSSLYRESFADARFELVLAHENAVDVDAIGAELADGVLRLSLPKAAALKARRIAIS